MAPKKSLKKVVRKRRERKVVERGAAHIRSSFNNTIVTLTDTQALDTTKSYPEALISAKLNPMERRNSWRVCSR